MKTGGRCVQHLGMRIGLLLVRAGPDAVSPLKCDIFVGIVILLLHLAAFFCLISRATIHATTPTRFADLRTRRSEETADGPASVTPGNKKPSPRGGFCKQFFRNYPRLHLPVLSHLKVAVAGGSVSLSQARRYLQSSAVAQGTSLQLPVAAAHMSKVPEQDSLVQPDWQ